MRVPLAHGLVALALLSCGPGSGTDEPVPDPGGEEEGGGEGEEGGGEDGGTDTGADEVVEGRLPLAAPRLLRRLSLDLRGVLPSVEELDLVEADPSQVWVHRDAWLEDPRLEERLVMLLAERWHTRVDEFLIFYLEYPAINGDSEVEYSFERSVGEEPLRLAARTVMEDRPWTEVVTSDTTVANPLLASIWPMDRPEDEGDGWVESRYTDGRPAAGILSTNGLWWRYYSTVTNYNRGRVAALTRMLICEDYAGRTISFNDADALSAGAEVEEALRQSPSCMGCHSAIDPVAATLFGFWPANEYNVDEVDHYHPEREAMGPLLLEVEGAWYGDPVAGLQELGAHIARDPRFSRCAVDTFATSLWRREVDLSDATLLMALDEDFVGEGQRVKPLLAALTETLAYQVGDFAPDTPQEVIDREVVHRMLGPDLLATVVEDLTGFRWTWEGYDQLDNDTIGFRLLAGGVDGSAVTRPQSSPGLTSTLVLQRLAEAAASATVGEDLEGTGPGLLQGVDRDTQPSDPAFASALDLLAWRLYGLRAAEVEADGSWPEHMTALWEVAAAGGGATAGWQAVVAGALQDPLFIGR